MHITQTRHSASLLGSGVGCANSVLVVPVSHKLRITSYYSDAAFFAIASHNRVFRRHELGRLPGGVNLLPNFGLRHYRLFTSSSEFFLGCFGL